MRRLSLLTPFLLISCVEEGLPPDSYNWEVAVTGVEDLCHPSDPQGYVEEGIVYSLFFDGSLTTVQIGQDSFAAGIMSGCSLEYDTPIVGERRGENEEFWVKWQITGDAVLRQGGSSCDLGDEWDWDGTEVFEIVETDDPDLPIGCTYTMSVKGTYIGRG